MLFVHAVCFMSEMQNINSISDISPEFLTSLFPAGKFQIMESTASSLAFLIFFLSSFLLGNAA